MWADSDGAGAEIKIKILTWWGSTIWPCSVLFLVCNPGQRSVSFVYCSVPSLSLGHRILHKDLSDVIHHKDTRLTNPVIPSLVKHQWSKVEGTTKITLHFRFHLDVSSCLIIMSRWDFIIAYRLRVIWYDGFGMNEIESRWWWWFTELEY